MDRYPGKGKGRATDSYGEGSSSRRNDRRSESPYRSGGSRPSSPDPYRERLGSLSRPGSPSSNGELPRTPRRTGALPRQASTLRDANDVIGVLQHAAQSYRDPPPSTPFPSLTGYDQPSSSNPGLYRQQGYQPLPDVPPPAYATTHPDNWQSVAALRSGPPPPRAPANWESPLSTETNFGLYSHRVGELARDHEQGALSLDDRLQRWSSHRPNDPHPSTSGQLSRSDRAAWTRRHGLQGNRGTRGASRGRGGSGL